MKKIIFVGVLFFSFAFTIPISNETASVSIAPESSLIINGTTNISSFKCKFNMGEINSPIPLYYTIVDQKMFFEKAKLVLNNHCFDCGHKGMNRDFLALLKSDEYPEILLELKEINPNSDDASLVNATLLLHLAGNTKRYQVPIVLEESKDIHVSGTLKLNIGDFDLQAPKKALGLIVVSEEITISFDMVFKENKN